MTGVPPPPYPGLSASNPSVHSSVSPPPSYYGPPTILTAPPSYSGLFPVIPADDSGCPHGLEYLIALDHIFIEQEIELLEALFACETENKYRVKNVMGQEIYFAVEMRLFQRLNSVLVNVLDLVELFVSKYMIWHTWK